MKTKRDQHCVWPRGQRRDLRIEIRGINGARLQCEDKLTTSMSRVEWPNRSTYDCGFERRLDLFGQQPLPIDVLCKEGVILDLLGSVDTQTLSRISVQ